MSALRELLARATPSPDFETSEEVRILEDAARTLHALAPELGLLAADMADALEAQYAQHTTSALEALDPCKCDDCERTRALLARYRQLEQKAGQ